MTTGRELHFGASIKNVARPVLLPIMRAMGWKPNSSPPIPHLSPADRLRDGDVPSKISVRADQTIMLNGSPFFPIGLYYAQCEIDDETGAGLRRLRTMGFNTIFFRGGLESEKQLDLIWSAGLHVCYRPPGELYRDYEVLKKVVSKFARHPALLLWEMDDEPVLNKLKLADVKVGSRIVRQIDPYHPITCNQWLSNLEQSDEMVKWAELADIYGFSIYPVPLWRWRERLSLVEQGWPHSLTVVGKQTDLWKFYAPGKPIIPVLQAWAWNCLEDGEAAYPTYEEGRFMAYQAIIHGAKGLHHYGAISVDRANFACGIPPRIDEDLDRTHADFVQARLYNQWFWSYYSKLIDELSRLAEVFTSSDATWDIEITTLAADQLQSIYVEHRVKKYADSAVILLVNASDSVAPVEIRAPQMANSTIKLWGTRKSLELDSDGRLHDLLEPYAVRIYSDQEDLLEGLTYSDNSEDES